jgi:site-specific recombinase
MAVSSLGLDGVSTGAFVAAAFGIAIVGLMNFGVSFALALVVALRARDVPRGERRTLPVAVFRKFFRKPLVFFYPPKEDQQVAPHGHGPGH